MEFRSGGEIINSGYFTVLVADDGGIRPNMTCPEGDVPDSGSSSKFIHVSCISNLSFTPKGLLEVANHVIGSGASKNSSNNSTGSNSGVSTAALGGAVGGVAVGILLIVGLLFFFAKKKGWIMSRRDAEKWFTDRLQSEESRRFIPDQHADKIPHLDGGQVHQLP